MIVKGSIGYYGLLFGLYGLFEEVVAYGYTGTCRTEPLEQHVTPDKQFGVVIPFLVVLSGIR